MKECTPDVTLVPIRNPYMFKYILQSKMERAITKDNSDATQLLKAAHARESGDMPSMKI